LVELERLEYLPDSAARFEQIRDLPWPAFLDSGTAAHCGARFDILTADPYLRVLARGERAEVLSRSGRQSYMSCEPLALIEACLGEPAEPLEPLPFAGGALGYFAYDLGRRYESLPAIAEDDIGVPDLAVGIYDWAVVVDHRERQSWLVGQGRDGKTQAIWAELRRRLAGHAVGSRRGSFEVCSPVRSNLTRHGYDRAFERVKEHIRLGDTYQVNLTQRFEAAVSGDAWQAYRRLREINPAPFSAYLEYPFGQVLSSSPERFLRVRGDRVETKPIKGTRRRHVNRQRDAELARELQTSVKDRAENVMIVDLLRNDLGKSCVAGSIAVTRLYDIESFASVHHMVSTVEGRLRPGCGPLQVLHGCFPGGSITGAPKLRAMQIIEELEPHRRSVYCGAIGYIGFDGASDTSIAIRTLLRRGGSIYAWAGGGIVADSIVDAEYQESLDKAAALLEVLEATSISVAS
jgi:para-aminobenzoate synthetase component 1